MAPDISELFFKNKEAMSLPDPCCVPESIDATVCQLPLGFWQG